MAPPPGVPAQHPWLAFLIALGVAFLAYVAYRATYYAIQRAERATAPPSVAVPLTSALRAAGDAIWTFASVTIVSFPILIGLLAIAYYLYGSIEGSWVTGASFVLHLPVVLVISVAAGLGAAILVAADPGILTAWNDRAAETGR